MTNIKEKARLLMADLEKTKEYFLQNYRKTKAPVSIYTHLDADGLSSGAILGKALYKERIPFQITVLKQLELSEIKKIVKQVQNYQNFLIFSDFGSGQYLELSTNLKVNGSPIPYIILDHHLPQSVKDKNDKKIRQIYEETTPWHINPYFYDINGSTEVSGSGICFYFAKSLNSKNDKLASIALIGAIGDIQNKGENGSFSGLNSLILNQALEFEDIEIINDLNFSSIKPLNEAIAYSSKINLAGLSGNPNKVLKFLLRLGIIMEKQNGQIKTLNDLKQEEKIKVNSALIEYATVKLDIEPSEIYNNLITKRYILTNEVVGSELHDLSEFSNLLNSCGRTNNGSLGIAIAMGDRRVAYKKAKDNLIDYKKSIMKSLRWLSENNIIQEREHIQFFDGKEVINEMIVGTIASMLIFDEASVIDKNKPLFGYAKRKGVDIYKVSGRAHQSIVDKGINLSEAIRDALQMSELEALGGGHPPAAGTKVPINKIELFLENLDKVVENQFQKNSN
ncbi:MAG: DHH family phosphoesterase [Promethearchaeota archaeon]|nr:MAG: DHH family phosphoesterase [Candidatus Lokiarchaeota archaeon]